MLIHKLKTYGEIMYKTKKIYVADFETTVYDGQDATEVWAAALVKLGTEDVTIDQSLEAFMLRLANMGSSIVYFHNLKFDGEFILAWLFENGFEPHLEKTGPRDIDIKFGSPSNMPGWSFIANISELGMWYSIHVKIGKAKIEFRDSLKLLPFSVKKIGKDFNTKHQKLEMEYKGFRYAGCEITPEERQYIANDVLVVKEALEIMFHEGLKGLTIGSCCLKEYKNIWQQSQYEYLFPNLYEFPLDPEIFGAENAFDYVNKSYHGGWCYLNPRYKDRVLHNGCTLDVNSLYPSRMYYERYPIGMPWFWTGNRIPEEARRPNMYYFVRFKCRFRLRAGKLPTVQIKHDLLYNPTEWLETSDIYVRSQKRYSSFYYDLDGQRTEAMPVLTMTGPDFKMFLEHYEVSDLTILDGCYFETMSGLFGSYIRHWMKVKETSKGAKRTIAKLMLNNLYGKMAASRRSDFKLPRYSQFDESVRYIAIMAEEKTPGYIPIGSAITSWSRIYTITAAQANYDRFIYADTDSIHCLGSPEELQGVEIHDTKLGAWKCESRWQDGIFHRQKTYIEREGDEYIIRCAGMPDSCKKVFEDGLWNGTYTLADFDKGLVLPGKLYPKRIKGGIVLCEGNFEMRF